LIETPLLVGLVQKTAIDTCAVKPTHRGGCGGSSSCYEMKLRAALHLHGRSRHNAAGRELMGADNQAEGVPERKRLSAIAKIKQDLAWRSVTGVPMMKNIILTRGQAEELVAEFEWLSSQGGKA